MAIKNMPEYFAYNQYRNHIIYKELSKVERVPAFRGVLERLTVHEFDDYEFWKQYSERKNFKVHRAGIFFYKILRRVFGLTFTAKFLEGRVGRMIEKYRTYIETVEDMGARSKMKEIMDHEIEYEARLISQVKESQVEFMSSIVLGLNDGLIELTGALTGFSLAMRDSALVASAGFITGLAAAMSMSASAFMQAQYEEGKNPKIAAAFTGAAYILVVILLATPFLLFKSVFLSLGVTFIVALFIITAASFYISVLFARAFKAQFSVMLLFSLGVAAAAFLIGLLFRYIGGITA